MKPEEARKRMQEIIDGYVSGKDDMSDYKINYHTLAGVFDKFYHGLDGHITILSKKFDNLIYLLFKSGQSYDSLRLIGTIIIESVDYGDYEVIKTKAQLYNLLLDIFKKAPGYSHLNKFVTVGKVSFRFNCESCKVSVDETKYMAELVSSMIFYMFNDDMSLNSEIKELEQADIKRDEKLHRLNPNLRADENKVKKAVQRNLDIIKMRYGCSYDYDSVK